MADLRWEPGESITIDYRFEYAELSDTQRLEQVRALTDEGFLGPPFTVYNDDIDMGFLDEVTSFREIVANDQKINAHTLWVDWEINDSMSLRSITGYRDLDSLTSGDALATATGDYSFLGAGVGGVSVARYQLDFEQFSQELQLLGNTDNWEYVAGLYYYHDKATQDGSSGELLGATGDLDVTDTDNESWALFSQATWNPAWLDRRWAITLGVRYSEDEREADRVNNRAVNPFSGSYQNDFDNVNPSLTVAFDINDDMNIYGKVASGYKSGGTSTRSANATLFSEGFEEEDIVSYELGFKGDFWNRRARLNAALFYMELDGLQTSIQTDPVSPGGRDFLPIDNNEIKGAEIDLTLLLTKGLTFTASYGHLDTELGEDSVDSPAGLFQLIDEFALAPENSYALSLTYHRPLSNGELGASLDYGWQDEVHTSVNLGDTTIIDDYGLLGAALSWSDIQLANVSGSFRVLAWGRNLTDEEYGLVNTAAWSTFGAKDVQTFGDPRTYGLTLTYLY